MKENSQLLEEARAAIAQAKAAARRGDFTACERWSKTAERLAASVARVAAVAPPADDPVELEALRAELRRRLLGVAAALYENRREALPAMFAAMPPGHVAALCDAELEGSAEGEELARIKARAAKGSVPSTP